MDKSDERMWNFIKELESIKKNHDSKIEKYSVWGFPGGAVVKNLPANAGDTGSYCVSFSNSLESSAYQLKYFLQEGLR